jgi:hypothetical protein
LGKEASFTSSTPAIARWSKFRPDADHRGQRDIWPDHLLAVAPDAKLYITQPVNNQVIALPWNRNTVAYGTQTTVGADLNGPIDVRL